LVESSKQGHLVYTRAQAQEPIMMWSPTWHYFGILFLGQLKKKKCSQNEDPTSWARSKALSFLYSILFLNLSCWMHIIVLNVEGEGLDIF
jgi:hypothetical protein